MEPIAKRGFTDPVRIEAEAKAIERATKQTEQVLVEYVAMPETFGGRYVCADSFKELMPGFAQSRESRSALNGAVHNAAAVLSSEQFKRLIDKGPAPGRDSVVFVTGIPGAGKSSTVAAAVQERAAIVFEGQLSRPESGMQKIAQALEKGFKVDIVVVHVAPEVALERTNYRFLDPNNGRGASLSVMAEIQGNLPTGLHLINERFGDRVGLEVLDNNPGHQDSYEGWQKVNFLQKEGNRDEIYARLSTALDAGYREGKYSAGFYTQAAGRQPHSLAAGIRTQDGGKQQTHGDRPGVSEVHSKHHSLKDELSAVDFRKFHNPAIMERMKIEKSKELDLDSTYKNLSESILEKIARRLEQPDLATYDTDKAKTRVALEYAVLATSYEKNLQGYVAARALALSDDHTKQMLLNAGAVALGRAYEKEPTIITGIFSAQISEPKLFKGHLEDPSLTKMVDNCKILVSKIVQNEYTNRTQSNDQLKNLPTKERADLEGKLAFLEAAIDNSTKNGKIPADTAKSLKEKIGARVFSQPPANLWEQKQKQHEKSYKEKQDFLKFYSSRGLELKKSVMDNVRSVSAEKSIKEISEKLMSQNKSHERPGLSR